MLRRERVLPPVVIDPEFQSGKFSTSVRAWKFVCKNLEERILVRRNLKQFVDCKDCAVSQIALVVC